MKRLHVSLRFQKESLRETYCESVRRVDVAAGLYFSYHTSRADTLVRTHVKHDLSCKYPPYTVIFTKEPLTSVWFNQIHPKTSFFIREDRRQGLGLSTSLLLVI